MQFTINMFNKLIVIFQFLHFSSEEFPYDSISFFKWEKVNTGYIWPVGKFEGYPVYVARLKVDDGNGNPVVGNYIPGIGNQITFAHEGKSRQITNHKMHKVELLQHNRPESLTWIHAYKDKVDGWDNELIRTTFSRIITFGDLTNGSTINACRAFQDNGENLVVGTHVINRDKNFISKGCLIHNSDGNEVLKERYELAAISFVGLNKLKNPTWTSTSDYSRPETFIKV